ncbi:MAG: hypothetical protein LPK38_03940, partial [Actinomycetes bacterium]|nr:hypothetical protein [Actinomycetes bacterium]MDX5380442.1 hypothetical protein [Actinomycetes bacterium]MDX5399272.1 hypothetical protein [Actinomycetes bacterium]MDX5450177.1 hypothetical protein [Actinomycetes bacterium]
MFSSIVAVMAAALLALVSTLGLWPVQRPDSAVSSGADGLARVQLTDVAGQRTAAAKGGLTPGAALALRTGPISVGEFLVAGLSWAAGEQLPADAEIRMRVREDTGWSDWLDVGPDGAS